MHLNSRRDFFSHTGGSFAGVALSSLLAGGIAGRKGRMTIDPQPVRNLHATLLTTLGLRPDDLFFESNGREERLTGVAQSWNLVPGVPGPG